MNGAETLPPHGFLVRALEPLLALPEAPPEIPAGARNPRVFRASVRYLRYRYLKLLVLLLAEIHGSIVLVSAAFKVHFYFGVVMIIFLTLATAAFLAVAYAAIRLDYDLHQYVVTDRALRIRSGAFVVQEVTITYANVQDVEIQQGPVQRLFGIADLVVRTAGGSSLKKGEAGSGGGHRGALSGIANPNEVRDLVLAALRAYRDAGLGDPDDSRRAHAAPAISGSADLRGASLDLAEAAAELRAALASTECL